MPPKKAAAVAGNGGSSAGKDTKRKRGQADATTDDVANEVVYQPAKKAKVRSIPHLLLATLTVSKPAPASKGKGRAKSPTTKPATKTPPKPRAPKPAAKKAQVTSKESKSKDVASKDATEPEPDLVKAALVKMEQAHEKKRKIAPSRSRKRAGVVGNPQVGAKREAPNAIKNDSDELLPEDEYPPAVFDKKGSLPIPKRYEQACKADRLALQWTQKGVARKKIAIRYSELVGREFQESNISSRVSRMESNFMQVRAQHVSTHCQQHSK